MRRLLPLALRAAITLAAFALAWRIGRGIADQPALRLVQPGWLVAAAVLHLAILWLLALRLRLTLAVLDPGPALPGMSLLFRMHWGSLGVSQIALGTIGGDALRVALLAGPERPWPQALRLIIADRVIGLGGLVALGSAALLAVLPAPQGGMLAVGLAAATALAGLALWHVPKAGGGRWREPLRVARLLRRVFAVRTGWTCLALAIASHGLSVLVFLACAKALGLAPPLATTLIAVPAGLLVSSVPVSLGGWGLREVSIAATYRVLESTFPGAVATSVVYGLTHVAMGLAGLVFIWHDLGLVLRRRNTP